MNKRIVTKINNNIRDIRKAKNIKQSELAAAIGVSQSRIAEYETGKISINNITLETAFKVAKALESTLTDVFTKSTEIVESDYKYGIFAASCELRKYSRAWDFVENDTEIDSPLEIFKTEQEARAALEKYSSNVTKHRSNGGYNFFAGKVYFVADLIVYDKDSEDDTDKQIYACGDGIEITAID